MAISQRSRFLLRWLLYRSPKSTSSYQLLPDQPDDETRHKGISIGDIKDSEELLGYGCEAIETGLYQVKGIEERPERPPSKLAVVPIYAFTARIFEELARTKPGKGVEIQLTDAINPL